MALKLFLFKLTLSSFKAFVAFSQKFWEIFYRRRRCFRSRHMLLLVRARVIWAARACPDMHWFRVKYLVRENSVYFSAALWNWKIIVALSCWKDYVLEKVLCMFKGSEKSQFSDSCGCTNLQYKMKKKLKCREESFLKEWNQLCRGSDR